MAINCGLCGKPMKQSIGKVRIVYDKGSTIGRKVKNPDSNPQWHKECRAEGRRLQRKAEKKAIKGVK